MRQLCLPNFLSFQILFYGPKVMSPRRCDQKSYQTPDKLLQQVKTINLPIPTLSVGSELLGLDNLRGLSKQVGEIRHVLEGNLTTDGNAPLLLTLFLSEGKLTASCRNSKQRQFYRYR